MSRRRSRPVPQLTPVRPQGRERFDKKKPPKGERLRKHAPLPAPTSSKQGFQLSKQPSGGVRKQLGGKGDRGARPKKTAAAGLPLGFSPGQRVLLVGEGNLSFARALLRLLGGHVPPGQLVATTFDSEAALHEKYAGVEATLEELRAGGVLVAFGIDATDLAKDLAMLRRRHRREAAEAASPGGVKERAVQVPETFQRVVFMFPHRGAGIKDQAAGVLSNQELLVGFFRTALPLLSSDLEAELLVTLKAGMPYSLWNAPRLASQATGNVLALRTALAFDAAAFPEYEHRKTRGDAPSRPNAEELAGGARTYVWRRAAVV